MTRNYLLSLKPLKFGDTIWKVWPIPSMLLWIIKTLSIFLLPRYWSGDKCGSLSISPSSTLSSGSALVILAQNWMLLLNNGMSILKGEILAMPQSTLITSFTQEQLAASIWATVLLFPSLCTATVVDLDTLYQNILSALSSDPIAIKHTSVDGQWSIDPNSLLLLDNRIYVPSTSNLYTYIFQYNHDHILAEHFGQNKTLKLVCHRYSWPSLHADIQQFYKSYVTYI